MAVTQKEAGLVQLEALLGKGGEFGQCFLLVRDDHFVVVICQESFGMRGQ